MARDDTIAVPKQIVPCRKGWHARQLQCRYLQELPPDKSVSAGYSSTVAERTSAPEMLHLVIAWMESHPSAWWLLKPSSYFQSACIYVKRF